MTMNGSDKSSRVEASGQPRVLTGRMVLSYLVAFFAVVASVNAVMVRAAISTFSGIETRNPYQAGLSYSREEAAARAQETRHWQVTAKLRHQSDGETALELSARDKANQPLTDLDARVTLEHPTDRRLDHPVDMRLDGPGHFRGASTPEPGQWDLVIDLTRGGERLFRSRERVTLR
jgi:nitrogen fixation protein FixH